MPSAPTKRRGRPEVEVDAKTRAMVESMAGFGVPERDIARTVGIDAKTLRKHYRDELDLGIVRANNQVAQSLFKKATGKDPGAVTAAIFWLKTRAQWRETNITELVPADGAKSFSHEHRHSLDPASAKLIADLIK